MSGIAYWSKTTVIFINVVSDDQKHLGLWFVSWTSYSDPPPLDQRQKGARLDMMYKAVNGKIALQIPEYVKPKQKITREYHPINIYPYNPYEQYLQIHFFME